jgi:hypothetical protein
MYTDLPPLELRQRRIKIGKKKRIKAGTKKFEKKALLYALLKFSVLMYFRVGFVPDPEAFFGLNPDPEPRNAQPRKPRTPNGRPRRG